jgi:WD40 repeat protein
LDERLALCSRQIFALAHLWYHLDRNAVPEEYVLKSLSHMSDDSFWKDALPNLSAALDGLRFSSSKPSDGSDFDSELLVGRSVTEWETKAALSQSASVSRMFWMRRIFDGGVDPMQDINRLYCDTVDDLDRQEKLEQLKSFMTAKLPADKIMSHGVGFRNYLQKDDALWAAHISKWTEDVHTMLTNSLADLTHLRQDWDIDGCGLGIPGYALNEMLHHSYWAADKCSTFHGREGLIQAALLTLADKNIVSVMNKLALLRRIRKRTFHKAETSRSLSKDGSNCDSFDRLFMPSKSRLTRTNDRVIERIEASSAMMASPQHMAPRAITFSNSKDADVEYADGIVRVLRTKSTREGSLASPDSGLKSIKESPRESSNDGSASKKTIPRKSLSRSRHSLEQVLRDAGSFIIPANRPSPRKQLTRSMHSLEQVLRDAGSFIIPSQALKGSPRELSSETTIDNQIQTRSLPPSAESLEQALKDAKMPSENTDSSRSPPQMEEMILNGLERKDSLDAFSMCSGDVSIDDTEEDSDDDDGHNGLARFDEFDDDFEFDDDDGGPSDDDEETIYASNPWVRLKLGILLNIDDIMKIFHELKESFNRSVFKINNASFHRSSFYGKVPTLRSPQSSPKGGSNNRAPDAFATPTPNTGPSTNGSADSGGSGGSGDANKDTGSITPKAMKRFTFSARAVSSSGRRKSERMTTPRLLSRGMSRDNSTTPRQLEGLRRMTKSHIKFSELHSTSSIQRKSSNLGLGRDGYKGVSLCVVGPSGSGKTALMAMLAADIAKNQLHKNRLVIIRFCGTSPGSTTGLSLVQSICHQIEFGVGKPFNKKIQTMNYRDLVPYFHSLMALHPVVLLIDSLDQLSDADLARSDISFLKGILPHPKSRIIVSTLPDERATSGEWIYYYGCDSKLAAADVKRMEVPPFQTPATTNASQYQIGSFSSANTNVDTNSSLESMVGINGKPLTIIPTAYAGSSTHSLTSFSSQKFGSVSANEGEGINIMRSMLARRRRTLTPMQWTYVIDQAAVEPTALYFWLAVRVVEKWSSNSAIDVDVRLAPGVKALINQIFDEVERNYGRELTRAAVGFITFSVSGVSDAEMEDLLSLDAEVMESVNQYCHDAKRLPSHVWLRLRGVIYGLVTEREGGCLGWYHRQLRETAEARYSVHDRLRLHTLMGKYYGGLIDEQTLDRTDISIQPLIHNSSNIMSVWLPDARINSRRCEEAASHLIKANMFNEAAQELCSIEAVVARAKTGQGFTLITHLSALKRDREVVDHYYRWIRRDIHSILMNPALNTTITCGRQPLSSLARKDLISCMRNYQVTKFVNPQLVIRGDSARDERGRRPSKTLVTEGGGNAITYTNPDVWLRGRCLGGEHDFDPVQSILQSHTEAISCVCYNTDGSKIASASWDRSVKIWDSSVGNILCTLEGHTDAVTSVAFNRDSALVVTASEDKAIKIWDAVVGSLTRSLEGHTSTVNSACFSPDSLVVVSGSNDSTVRVWDTLSGTCEKVLEGHTNNVATVRVSYDSKLIASGSHDSSIRLWGFRDHNVKHILSGHSDRVNGICFSYDSRILVSGSDDETLRTWDVNTGVCLNVFEGQHDPVPSVCINSDGTVIISGAWDSTIRVWDSATGQLYCSLAGHTGTVSSVCMFENGETIVSGSEDRSVRIWDLNIWYDSRTSGVGHTGYVTCCAFSPDGKYIVSGSEDKTIVVWETQSGEAVRTMEGHTGEITSVAICTDNSKVVSGSSDHAMKVWSLTTGALLSSIQNRFDQPFVSFHPSGEFVAASSYSYAIRLWGLNGKLVHTLKGHTGDVTSIAFNATGSRMLSGSCDCTVSVWDILQNVCLYSLTGHELKVTSVSWSSDESKVASGSEDLTIRIWSLETRSNSVSEDGASSCSSRDYSAQLLWVLSGHADIVTSVGLNAAGTTLVSGSWDSTVRVWSVQSGEMVHNLEGHSSRVNAVSLTADGYKAVSGSDDKSLLVWDASSGVHVPSRWHSKNQLHGGSTGSTGSN